MLRLLLLIILGTSLPQASALADTPDAATVSLPIAENLHRDAQQAAMEKRPIVLLVSQHHCPYCKRIKRDVLHPMIIAGDYKDQILMRELYIDQPADITGFRGERLKGHTIAGRLNATLTPTLLFLDPKGEELVERITGYYTPEFFFYYVDQAIRKAIEALNP